LFPTELRPPHPVLRLFALNAVSVPALRQGQRLLLIVLVAEQSTGRPRVGRLPRLRMVPVQGLESFHERLLHLPLRQSGGRQLVRGALHFVPPSFPIDPLPELRLRFAAHMTPICPSL